MILLSLYGSGVGEGQEQFLREMSAVPREGERVALSDGVRAGRGWGRAVYENFSYYSLQSKYLQSKNNEIK